MLTQMLKQVSPGVEDPSYTRECQDPCFRPLFLCCVARVVDEDVSTSGFDLFLVPWWRTFLHSPADEREPAEQ